MGLHDSLGDRMKNNYENRAKTSLVRRMPVAIRIDGKAFHSFVRGFKKPFDDILIESMQETTKYLCQNIQGCVLGYTQSDEITLVLQDYKTLTTDAWFDYEVQKICSIAASMTTMKFNQIFDSKVKKYGRTHENACYDDYFIALNKALVKGAMFDARCFNIPKEEVTNMIYWRQLDATRNSIQMVGQANFSHKELNGKSCNMIQDMLFTQKGINWNNFATYYKRGTAVIKVDDDWLIDKNMPELVGESRDYVERFIYCEEN